MKRISLLIPLFVLCLYTKAQDAYQLKLLDTLNKRHGLTKDIKWVLPNTEAGALSASSNYGGTTSNISVTDALFTLGRTRVVSQGANAWDAAHSYRNKSAVVKGDKLLVVFWMKSATPNAKVTLFVEHATNYNKEFNASISLTNTWRMYLAPIELSADYAVDGLTIGIHLAAISQTIDIGGVACLNYEKKLIFNQLPLDVGDTKYTGMEPNAVWRSEADQSIDLLRKANFKVKVTNGGQPVNNAEVRFEMLQHEFKFGTAVVSNKFNGGSAFDATYEQKLLNLDGKGHGFNEIVFENDLKWPAWEQRWFSSKEEIAQDIAWLKAKKISIRGHNLVWPGWQYSPSDINANQSVDFIKKRIRDHITAITSYQGVGKECQDWDVLNEITTNNDYANHFAGKSGYITGRELYAEIFKQADSLLPNSKLYINDYIAIEAGDGPTTNINTWKQRIDEILAKNARIDGIGFQGHFSSSPTGIPRVKEIYDEFWNKYKKEAKVTEYDISNLIKPDIQAQYLRDILTISFAHPSMKGFLMWGFWDGAHWLSNAPIYNKDWTLKPSGTAFIDQIFNKWWTDTKVNSNTSGEALTRGFKGSYKITVKLPDGRIGTQVVDFTKDTTITLSNFSTKTHDLTVDYSMQIIPNPSVFPAKIIWDGTVSNAGAQLEIRNNIGSLVYSKKVNMADGMVDMNQYQLVKGIYFVSLKSEKGIQTVKWVLN